VNIQGQLRQVSAERGEVLAVVERLHWSRLVKAQEYADDSYNLGPLSQAIKV
jgi:hypothetical protein